MTQNTLNLIQFIVCFATNHEITLTTLRLVKFVYLADLYHARSNEGRTFTGFPWAFVHFGPYCSEVMSSIDKAVSLNLIEMKTMESRYSGSKDYNLFSCKEDVTDQLRDLFPADVVSVLQASIKKFGEDTPSLLDYVYFHTEPMTDAQKGQRLDFSKAEHFDVAPVDRGKSLSVKDVARIREHISRLGEKFGQARGALKKEALGTRRWRDDIYYETLECLDQEPTLSGLKGTAKIID